jgi:hypothetical protein
MYEEKFTFEDVKKFLEGVRLLNLAKAPILTSEGEKDAQAMHWHAEMGKCKRRHLRNLWHYIRVKCKFYPTIAQVIEQLDLLENLDNYHIASENESYKMLDQIAGFKIVPPIAIRSATLKAAMIRQYGEKGAELPVVNFGTGEIKWQGQIIGNAIKDYGLEHRIQKLRELNKNVQEN